MLITSVYIHCNLDLHYLFTICYLLCLLFITSLFNPRTWQSFSTISLQVFFGLPLGLAPFTSYSIHFFTQSLSSFLNTCPYHRSLFCCSTEIMSSNPSLSLNPLLGILSCSSHSSSCCSSSSSSSSRYGVCLLLSQVAWWSDEACESHSAFSEWCFGVFIAK